MRRPAAPRTPLPISTVVHVTAECPSSWQHCETSVQNSGHPPSIVGGDGGIGGGKGGGGSPTTGGGGVAEIVELWRIVGGDGGAGGGGLGSYATICLEKPLALALHSALFAAASNTAVAASSASRTSSSCACVKPGVVMTML